MPNDLSFAMRAWRHHLHAHPELSCHEAATAAYVCAQLGAMGVPHWGGIGGHGVVGVIERGSGGRAVGLRADMDALPILEATGLGHASRHQGVMHACGHDGHTASLLGAARALLEDEGWRGRVVLVFQPAEEGFGGAEAMLRDGLLTRFPMERIFGYHNWPGLNAGEVVLHEGPCMAGAVNFEITLKGRAAHAAMPHLSADPVQGVAQLILALNGVVARNLDPLAAGVISVCTLKAGEARNQVPQSAAMGGTMRALTPEVMALLRRRVVALAEGIAAANGLEAAVELFSALEPTINHAPEAALAARAAKQAGLNVCRDVPPSMAAEDFGRFLAEIPGAYAWIGNGGSAPLHNPAYDYNDEILPVAASYYVAVAKAALA
jgi:hippurate hydrolase